jgi:uncharacterized protein YggU (UPF0235/DUF167 family)
MRISVSVKPGSKQAGVEKNGEHVIVRVRERAIEGEATAACIRALAGYFGVAPSRVRLVHGERSRKKLFEVDV